MSTNPFEQDNDDDDERSNGRYESITMKKNALEDSMLDSTRRALNMLIESEDVGIESATELVNQGEALNRIDKKLNSIDGNLSATQRNISKLKSPFGAFSAKLFGSTKSMLSSISSNKTQNQNNTKSDTNLSRYLNTKSSNSHTSNNTSSQYEQNQSSQSSTFRQLTGSDREKEVEQNLNNMSSYLTRLKDLATNMGDEIDRQNVMISGIKESSEKVESRMTGQREALQKLLKK